MILISCISYLYKYGRRMGSLSPENHYLEILVQNGILDKVAKVQISVPTDLVGEHFGSICEAVLIDFVDEGKEDLHLFVKKMILAPDPVQLEMMGDIMLKEGFFLTRTVKALRDFCLDKLGDDPLAQEIEEMFPKTYHADKASIVLENIKVKGYKMENKEVRQTMNHAKLVIDGLAKLHGISYALIQENGGRDEYLKANPLLADVMIKPESEPIMSSFLNPSGDAAAEMLKESSQEGSQELLAKLEKYQGKWFWTMMKASQTRSLLPVLNHGDCWNNNMMFLPQAGVQGPGKLIFYDMQNGRVSCPGADLSYYILTSLQADVRNQWKSLLQTYFKTFQEIVEKFGLSLSVTYEEFLLEYRRVIKLGAFFGMAQSVGMDAFKSHDTESESLFTKPDGMKDLLRNYVANNKDKVEGIVGKLISLMKDVEDMDPL